MKVSILTIGTELLFGQIVNTNAAYLSKELNDLGFDVYHHYTVGDNKKRILEQFEIAFKDSDIVITTGGLGPTQDDITKQLACKYFGYDMYLNEGQLDIIKRKFKARNTVMDENNKRQAYFSKDAIILKNDYGTAPGCVIEKEGKYIICLPGPPYELQPMFENIRKFLLSLTSEHIYYRFVRTIGIGESALETKIMDIIKGQGKTTIAPYASMGETTLRITSKDKNLEVAKNNVEEMIEVLEGRIGEYIYSTDGSNLITSTVKLLIEQNKTIATAESCTGGLFASSIIDINGASKCFERGFIAYSNKAKEEIFVPHEVIEKHGAVSSQTAISMAKGVIKAAGSDIGISVTGIAGPSGGTIEKPVGLVYMAIASHDKEVVLKKEYFHLSRNDVRKRACLDMTKMLFDFIR